MEKIYTDAELLEMALDASDMAWWRMELPSGVVFFSDKKVKMLDRKAKDFVQYKSFTDLVHKDDYEPMMKAMYDHLEGKADTYETTYRIKTKSGDYKLFYDRGKIISQEGKDIVVAGMVLNVTDTMKRKIAASAN